MKIFIITEKATNKVKNIFTWHNENDLPEDYPIAEDEEIITTENEEIYEEYLERQGQNKSFKLIDIDKNTFDEMFEEEIEAEPEARMDIAEEIRIIREAVYKIITEVKIQDTSEFENYYSKMNNK